MWRLYSNIRIYWSQIFILTFVHINFSLTNIFGHSFVSVLECKNSTNIQIFIQFSNIYLDIHLLYKYIRIFLRVKFVMQIYLDIRLCKFSIQIYLDIHTPHQTLPKYQHTLSKYQRALSKYQFSSIIYDIFTLGIFFILTRWKQSSKCVIFFTFCGSPLKFFLRSVFPCPGFAHSNDIRPRHPNVSECTQLCLLTMSGRMSVWHETILLKSAPPS